LNLKIITVNGVDHTITGLDTMSGRSVTVSLSPTTRINDQPLGSSTILPEDAVVVQAVENQGSGYKVVNIEVNQWSAYALVTDVTATSFRFEQLNYHTFAIYDGPLTPQDGNVRATLAVPQRSAAIFGMSSAAIPFSMIHPGLHVRIVGQKSPSSPS